MVCKDVSRLALKAFLAEKRCYQIRGFTPLSDANYGFKSQQKSIFVDCCFCLTVQDYY